MEVDLKIYEDKIYKIIGASMEVHQELGWGLAEPIYNEALCIELRNQGIECEAEKLLRCYYKHYQLEKTYRMDIVVGDIIVELKSVSDILPEHRAQLFNYLRLTKKTIGLLINFGRSRMQGERYAFLEDTNRCVMLDRNMNIINEELYKGK